MLQDFLNKLDYPLLIMMSLMLGLAPFFPEPHLFEKIKMLLAGTLKRPIDIFDLFFHGAPIILLVLKFVMDKTKG